MQPYRHVRLLGSKVSTVAPKVVVVSSVDNSKLLRLQEDQKKRRRRKKEHVLKTGNIILSF